MTKQELLFASCKSGDIQQFEEALKKGFFTKKIWQEMCNEVDAVCEYLIKSGANMYCRNADGELPLTQVIRHELMKSLDAMLSRNIDLTLFVGRFKDTPLKFAQSLGKTKIVNKLSGNAESTDGQNPPAYNQPETRKYSLSVKIASVMGESVYAKFNGETNTVVEKWIIARANEFPGYYDFSEKPNAFKDCIVYFHKRVDIHEAAAILSAKQEAEPTSNTRAEESVKMTYCFTGVGGCRASGKIAWPVGEMQITRIVLPSSEQDMFDLVIVDN